jgi:hypothetical protein
MIPHTKLRCRFPGLSLLSWCDCSQSGSHLVVFSHRKTIRNEAWAGHSKHALPTDLVGRSDKNIQEQKIARHETEFKDQLRNVALERDRLLDKVE